MVRVDFFKPSGKWFCTLAVEWTGGYKDVFIHNAFKKSLRDHFAGKGDGKGLSDMTAVCLHPYHEYAHPISLIEGEWNKADPVYEKIEDML